ncbi:MAG: adenine phosphoribosyltransferase [Thermoplasmata archaeon]|nr:MAG: adenine phosphoribosyltransferase [Thermoplasmata archaeon]
MKMLQSLKEAPIVKKGNYSYVVHPLTDGIPKIEPDLLKEVVKKIKEKMPKCDRIVTIEAMGIPIATALSLEMNIPFTIIRKRQYGLPGEVSVEQMTGYSRSHLFINGIKKGESIVIVDDVISTGGTLSAVVSALKKMGVEIKKIFIAINKGNIEELEKKVGMKIDVLVTIEVNDETKIIS